MSTPPPPMPQAALPQQPSEPGLSEPARIINTFVAPSKTFEDIKRNQSWIWPWLIGAIVGLAFAFVAVQKLDTAQLVQKAIERNPSAQRRMEQTPPEQRDRIIEAQGKVTKVIFFVIPTLGALLLGLIVGAVLLGVFNFGFGTDLSFRHALSITFYSLLPGIIGAILLIVSILVSSDPNSIDFASGNPLPTTPAFFMDPTGNQFLYKLLSSVDLFHIWYMILLGLGFATVASAGRKKLAPSTAIVTIFVIYFVLAIARAGISAAF